MFIKYDRVFNISTVIRRDIGNYKKVAAWPVSKKHLVM